MSVLDRLPLAIVAHTGDPAVAAAAGEAGALGVLSTEYEGAERFLADVATARAATGGPLGACGWAAGGATGDPARYAAYALSPAAMAGGGLGRPRFSDDVFDAQVAGLVRDPLAVVE